VNENEIEKNQDLADKVYHTGAYGFA